MPLGPSLVSLPMWFACREWGTKAQLIFCKSDFKPLFFKGYEKSSKFSKLCKLNFFFYLFLIAWSLWSEKVKEQILFFSFPSKYIFYFCFSLTSSIVWTYFMWSATFIFAVMTFSRFLPSIFFLFLHECVFLFFYSFHHLTFPFLCSTNSKLATPSISSYLNLRHHVDLLIIFFFS